MKIVFLCTDIPAAGNTTAFQRAKYLSEKHDVYFVCQREVCDDIRDEAKKVATCPGHSLYLDRIIFPLWALLKVLMIHKVEHIDVIHSSRDSLDLITGFLLKKLGFRWVADIWDDPGLSVETSRGYRGFRSKARLLYHFLMFFLAKRCLKYADLVIITMLPDVLKSYNIENSKILPVTNGVDLNITKPLPVVSQKDRFTITYVGHLKKIRGMDTILSAANYLKEEISSFSVCLVGYTENEDRKWLIELIRQEDLEDNVELVGKVSHEEALRRIASSDICLNTLSPAVRNYRYAYPIKIFEYMAMGKAVISTDLPGVRKIIKHRENGLLVEPDNPRELAKAILQIYSNPTLKERLEQNALEDIKQYDWPGINRQVEQAIMSKLLALKGQV
jgi:glycosyltransferase involved in cell wall biosynthesis